MEQLRLTFRNCVLSTLKLLAGLAGRGTLR